jgi:hypothetical protein
MPSDIVLIGPMRAGKTTLGGLIAARLRQPQTVSLDILGGLYAQEAGFDLARAAQIQATEGPLGFLRYSRQFYPYAVERVLQDYPGRVIDFGAGHSVYDEPAQFERLQQTLALYPNVVLVLPSPDLDESARILRERGAHKPNQFQDEFRVRHGFDLNEYFLRHPSNFVLAKHVVYTVGRSPEESRDEILTRVTSLNLRDV